MDEIDKVVNEDFDKSEVWNGWSIAKILLDIRRQDKEEIERAISAAKYAQKSKRLAMLFCGLSTAACIVTIIYSLLA